jgi:NAD-dependent dihydropyrimidine dehydrogenase PreA subunit
VLQPLAFEQGLEGLWTPHVVADWAGCESSCNACGQVCPTGAIRALPLDEKRHARIGLAVVNEQTCLPFANREACQLCVDECNAAGYKAIEFMQVHTLTDELGSPIAESGHLAPVVTADRCVGCGLCQTRCFGINVQEKGLLAESAIVIHAGGDREDRMLSGSYLPARTDTSSTANSRPPDKDSDDHQPEHHDENDPFGLN